MEAKHNGTSHAILGLLDGVEQTQPLAWDVDVVAAIDVAAFHGLTARYPSMRIRDTPVGTYLAVVHLTQPWTMATIAELHRVARYMIFYFYDTIAWDAIYPAPERLDSVWRMAAVYSDGLLFDSQFSLERFAFRFPMRPSTSTGVTHLSLAAAESLITGPPRSAGHRYILVMGNSLDHKDVDRTTRILSGAFPTTPITALGCAQAPTAMVTALPSGNIDGSELDDLMANATAVVFPSYYEGFGLPVTAGLANGRTVIVRSSPLWVEIADHTRMPGALVPFQDTAELVEAVGRALDGRPPQALAQGRALGPGEEPAHWRDCSVRMLALVDEVVARSDGEAWVARDTALDPLGLSLTDAAEAERTWWAVRAALEQQLASSANEIVALGVELERTNAALASSTDHLAALNVRFERTNVELEQTQVALDASEQTAEGRRQELAAMLASHSWRLTAPLRRVTRSVRRRG